MHRKITDGDKVGYPTLHDDEKPRGSSVATESSDAVPPYLIERQEESEMGKAAHIIVPLFK